MRKKTIFNLLDHYISNPAFEKEWGRALEQFFGCPAEEVESLDIELEEAFPLFKEWLIYDFRMKNGSTPLEDFCKRNPLNLPENRLKDYEDILENEYGLYEILQVKWHEGMRIRNLQTEKEYWVKEKLGTEQARSGMIIFARAGKTGDHWELVGANSPVLPMKIGEGAKKYFIEAKDAITPLTTYQLFYRHGSTEKSPARIEEKDPAKAMDNFQRELEKIGLDSLISAATAKEWIRDGKWEGHPEYYLNLICGLLTEDESEEDTSSLIAAFNDLYNTTAQKALKGKSPCELQAEQEGKEGDFRANISETKGWPEHYRQALECLKKNDPVQAMKHYDGCFESLLAEKTADREIYRLFANKAMTHFQLGDKGEGEAMLKMALELNPNYDFARDAMQRYQEGKYDSIIERGIKISSQDPSLPANKWDFDKVRNKWTAKKTLSKLEGYGIKIDEKTFRKVKRPTPRPPTLTFESVCAS